MAKPFPDYEVLPVYSGWAVARPGNIPVPICNCPAEVDARFVANVLNALSTEQFIEQSRRAVQECQSEKVA